LPEKAAEGIPDIFKIPEKIFETTSLPEKSGYQ
jgi:hypothetical protein